MKKLAIICTLLIILLAGTVKAQSNLTIINETASLTGNVSDTVTGNFTLNNTGNVTLSQIEFDNTKLQNSRNNISANKVSYSPNDIFNLNTTENKTVDFNIDIPADAFADTYTATITAADNNGNGANNDSFTFSLEVDESSDFSISDETMTIVENHVKSTNFTLQNTGNTDLENIEITYTKLEGSNENISKGNINVAPDDINLAYKGSEKFTVTVNVPDNTSEGIYTGNITANYNNDEIIKVGELMVQVEAVDKDISIETGASNWIVNHTNSKDILANVTNNGNVDILVSPTINNITKYDEYIVIDNPSSEPISPGQTKTFRFEVNQEDADSATPGAYTGQANFSYDGKSELKTLTLNIENPNYDFSLTPNKFPEGERNETVSNTFNLKNNGNVPISNIRIGNESIHGKYEWSTTQIALGNMQPGEERSFDMEIRIPQNENSGTHGIGRILAKGNEYNQSFNLQIQVEEMLEISDLDVYIDGSKDSNLDDGDTIDDAKPGDEVEFEIEIENKFDDDDEDIEIEDIEVIVTLEDIDDGDDMEFTSDEFDIDADDKETIEATFDLPFEIEVDDYDVIIEVEGEDENGVDHKLEWHLTLPVEKENHEVRISDTDLSPSTLRCNRRATLTVEAMNIGEDDEDETVLTIENSDLGIDISEEFELEEDPFDDENTYEKRVSINLDEDFESGSYPIDIRLYYDTNDLDDVETVTLTVEDCDIDDTDDQDQDQDQDQDDDNGDEVVVEPTQPTEPSGPGAVPVQTETGDSFTESTAYLAILIALVVGALGGTILLIASLIKR